MVSVDTMRELAFFNLVPRASFLAREKALGTRLGGFKFFWFEERLQKVPFSWRISVDGRPNRRNKAEFSNSSGVVRTGP